MGTTVLGVRSTRSIQYKILFIGPSGSGKTSLINVASGKPFTENVIPTVFADTKNIQQKDDKDSTYQFQIWDLSATAEKTSNFVEGTDLYGFVVDVTNLENSLLALKQLYNSITKNPESKPKFFLIGNKMDLYLETYPSERHEQLKDEVKSILNQFAREDLHLSENDVQVLLTSAKTGEGASDLWGLFLKALNSRQNEIEKNTTFAPIVEAIRMLEERAETVDNFTRLRERVKTLKVELEKSYDRQMALNLYPNNVRNLSPSILALVKNLCGENNSKELTKDTDNDKESLSKCIKEFNKAVFENFPVDDSHIHKLAIGIVLAAILIASLSFGAGGLFLIAGVSVLAGASVGGVAGVGVVLASLPKSIPFFQKEFQAANEKNEEASTIQRLGTSISNKAGRYSSPSLVDTLTMQL